MRCPTLAELPPPPPGKAGWPWTVESPQIPDAMPDGRPWPRISIVTPSYNQGEFIEETIRSILLQSYPNLEYQVLDGGSNDETVEIIKKYEPWLARWRSERDGGQAAAINLGLQLATGEWFQNINSDDVLELNALARIGSCPTAVDLVYGDVEEFAGTESYLVNNTRPSVRDLIRPLYRTNQVSWHQPGVFLKRDKILQLGGYNPSLGYQFDLHLTAKYVEQFPKSHRIDGALVRFRIHDSAKSSAWRAVYETESIRARDLLSEELMKPANRRLARRESNRRRLIAEISAAMNDAAAESHSTRALELVARNPTLALDRMFVGSLKRRPIFWLRTALGRRS